MEQVYKKVGSITFGMMSPSMVRKTAAAKVVTPELYDKEGYPVDGGLMDVRLGIIDPGLRCKTCGGKLKECNGHFGFIDLARPVVHINYVKQILNILRCTCKGCSRILLADEKIKIQLAELDRIEKQHGADARRKAINALIVKLRLIKKCPHCNMKQGVVKIEKPTTYTENDRRITPIEVRTKLEKVSEEDIVLLGFNPQYAKPEWMILTVLSVPPVTARPSITLDTGERSEDDLTHKLGDIVRINQRLFENINAGAPEIIIEDLWDLLQYHITTFFDNTTSSVPPARHRSGQPLKTLVERIKSKDGRFRYNLAGKRVNFSARTVISPDPRIDFNEVGIPLEVAKELTVPDIVTEWNKDWLIEFIKRGPEIYPGANYVIRPDGKKKRITEETREQLLEELQPSYVVERHLMDGDISIFNRQPSLHRMSIMCHRIKILPGRSFRLNPAVCTPYNADFDGDEMNLHIPQTEEARTEAELLMSVQRHIISPKNGLNIIGCIDDSIAGNYLLTEEMSFTKQGAIDLLMSVGVDNGVKFRKFGKVVSGKEVFSAMLPDDFDFVGQTRDYKEGDTGETVVRIKSGVLVSGVIDKATIGEDNGSLIRALYHKYGEDVGIDILSKMFRLGTEVLGRRGFTTSVSDTDLSDSVNKRIKQLLDSAEEDVAKLMRTYEDGKLEALPGMGVDETLELRILEVLNNVRNKIGERIQETVSEDNSTIIMARSGAKGNILNLAQMAACVGQQSLSGRRIDVGYRGRTLSMFKPNDLSPKSRGFVNVGFKQGLKPHEYFYGAMTGRDSLMDTALRTPKSGYLYRRLANALQDLRVEYDHTVRDASKNILQFRYGEDGIDVSLSEGGTIDVKQIIKNILNE
tara:strand:- start:3218 stop:5809 length:2592 start_codon:yes stop_codon:yes gene_type:complete